MPAARLQRTLAQTAAVSGRGYWSGAEVTVEFRPAAVDTGLVFVREDLPGEPRIPVSIATQQPTDRRTILERDGVRVEMVEHVLASLAGLGVDNCEVGVTGGEMPGMDGSALAFVEAITNAGLQDQAAVAPTLTVTHPLRCELGDQWIELRPPIGEGLSIEYNLDYGPASPIHPQWFVVDVTPNAFHTELAPARTFVLESEAEAIRSQGLAQHVSPGDLLIFGPDGPVDNQLRFSDECARHKALDVVGDLALAGRPIAGHVVACRSGHRLNGEIVRALLAANDQYDQATRRSA